MKKISKAVAIVVALLLIVGILVVTDSLVGNPISKHIATKRLKQYVAEYYGNLDITVEKVSYNFKSGTYDGVVSSKMSEDTMFYLSYRGGRIEDTYEEDVVGRWNTYCRLNEAFNEEIVTLCEKELPYTSSILFGELKKMEKIDGELVPLDMEYDSATVPFEKSLVLYVLAEELSVEELAKVMVEVDAMLTSNQQNLNWYSIVLEKDGESLGVYDFPKELVGSKELASILKQYVKS